MSWLNPTPSDYDFYALLNQQDDSVRLARLLAPALQVDTTLLRNMRMRYLPGTNASLESTLWFGDLTVSRSARAISFAPGVARLLTDSLDGEARLATITDFIESQIVDWPAELRLEQQLRLAARINDTMSIQQGLRTVLGWFEHAASDDDRDEILRWVRAAIPRLIKPEWQLQEAQWLIQLAAATLGDTTGELESASQSTEGLPDWLSSRLPQSGNGELGLNIRPGQLEFVEAGAGAHDFPAGPVIPALVGIKSPDSGKTSWERVWAGQVLPIPADAQQLELITLSGQRYELKIEHSRPIESIETGESPPSASGSDPETTEGLKRRVTDGFSPPGEPDMEESAAPLTETDERRVNAHIRFEGKNRKTFVRGAENIVRCWIGLPEEGFASSNEHIPPTAISEDGLPLTAQILWRSESDSAKIILPANKAARSSHCDLRLQVPDNARYISAELSFRYRGDVFETIKLEADALGKGEPEQDHHELLIQVEMQHREAIEIRDRKQVDSTIIWGEDKSGLDKPGDTEPSAMRIFGSGSPKHFDFSDAGKTIDFLTTELFITEKSLVRKRADRPEGAVEERLDDNDPDVIRLLRTLAEHGSGLYNQLTNAGFEDPGERIQLIHTDPEKYVPIEFVYDRGYPAQNATICVDGIKALNSNAADCPTCKPAHELTAVERDNVHTICPFGFWSLQKIIERRDTKPLSTGVEGPPSVPRAERRTLPAIDSALFASSYRVPKYERDKTKKALSACIADSAMALSWTDWKEKLMERKPSLLLLLPHHHSENNQDYLEIGANDLEKSDRLLARGRMTDQYINPAGIDPGPIVILLGARTATDSGKEFVQMAHRFQHLGASVVVGTLGTMLARHAAPVARELVEELVFISNYEADFGTIMRQVRRRMFGKGYLMAFCLVALGDAEWRMTPRNN